MARSYILPGECDVADAAEPIWLPPGGLPGVGVPLKFASNATSWALWPEMSRRKVRKV